MALDISNRKLPRTAEEKAKTESVRGFVEEAAEQEKPKKRRTAVKRKMCSFMIPEKLLEDLDAFSEKKALTRSALINLAIVKLLEDGL